MTHKTRPERKEISKRERRRKEERVKYKERTPKPYRRDNGPCCDKDLYGDWLGPDCGGI